ncbi:hypothetical protein [Amycolatopsis sp. CA-128772]|uniref:hypothetical protein n=1 Tax=Amycolatopsis sp. CA-128772 TaxID=2073159 RepID=UPI0011B0EA6C|nr:hypothetical protein [Amycolatopsis sp. CA-128772]
MQISLQKTETGGHRSTAQLSDGTRVLAFGSDHPHRVPHEFSHFLIERQLGLDWGYWGSIARGALFRGMSVLDGDEAAAAKRSASLKQSVMARIQVAEDLVGAVEGVLPLEAGRSPEQARAKIIEEHPELAETPAAGLDLAELDRLMTEAARTWAELPVGCEVRLTWDIPLVAR